MTIHEEQLIEKSYAPAEFSGLGRKYLQKNIVDVSGTDKNVLTQAMMQDGSGNALTNTIFVIQYDYDLNGQTVNVPAETTLKFDGGSIKNGTLNFGKGVLVESEDVKIFDDVLFTGDCVGQYFHIDWFVANYAQTIADTEPDATAEIQAMFDCGIKKVWLTNNHNYRITDTITIKANVLVNGVRQNSSFETDNTKYIFGEFDAPLITLKALPDQNVGVLLNNIYLYRLTTAYAATSQNNYKRDIPTLYVDCTVGSINGFDFWGVISQERVNYEYFSQDGTSFDRNYGAYRAIEVYVDYQEGSKYPNYFYNAKFGGRIHCYGEAIKIHRSNTASNISDATLSFDCDAVYGGYIGTDCVISGEHQTLHALPINEDAFYDILGKCTLVGTHIWDTGYLADMGGNDAPSTLFSTKYSVNAKSFEGGVTLYDLKAKNVETIKYNSARNSLGRASIYGNLLADAFYYGYSDSSCPSAIYNVKLRAFDSTQSYENYIGGDTTEGVALTKDNTVGFDQLFRPDTLFIDHSYVSQPISLSTYPSISGFAVKKVLLESNFNGEKTAVVNLFTTNIASVTIQVVTNGTVEDEVTYTAADYGNFPRTMYYPVASNSYQNTKIRFIVDYNSGTTQAWIPYMGLCAIGAGNLIGPWGGRVYGSLGAENLGVVSKEFPRLMYKYLTHPAMRYRIGDGGAGYRKVAHVVFRSTVSGFLEIKPSITSSRSVHVCFSNGSPFVVGDLANNQVKVYKKSTNEFVVAVSRMSNGYLNYAFSMYGITIYDDAATVDVSDTSVWTEIAITSNNSGTFYGTTSVRNSYTATGIGVRCIDTTLNKPVWTIASNSWVEADGAVAGVKRSGTTAQRPASTGIYTGFQYWDTTLGKMIAWNGSAWVNLDGTALA